MRITGQWCLQCSPKEGSFRPYNCIAPWWPLVNGWRQYLKERRGSPERVTPYGMERPVNVNVDGVHAVSFLLELETLLSLRRRQKCVIFV